MNELRAENLHLWRGETHVLRGVSFALQGGQCLQVTGANGAGKTSLLRALCGLMPLEEGTICWQERNIAIEPDEFHASLAYLGHDNGLKGDLTAAENLRYATGLRRRVLSDEIAAALTRSGVADCDDQLLRRMSAGQRRRVALARVSLAPAALWILDEPTANLDRDGRELVREMIDAHLRAGGTAVVATHQPLGLPEAQLQQLPLE